MLKYWQLLKFIMRLDYRILALANSGICINAHKVAILSARGLLCRSLIDSVIAAETIVFLADDRFNS
ncbi:hypothetical protein D918_07792 [Trichuris suis]|nr:hypothetical protein D918_07792 [Trichuris suis]